VADHVSDAAPSGAAERAVPELIVALDVPTESAAAALIGRLGAEATFYKVGHELFTAAGPTAVRQVRDADASLFLDLKFHDIPNTVRGAARSAAGLGARLITVHASGGGAMVAAAVEGAGERCGVLAVTVLTSLDAAALGSAWGRSVARVEDEVLRLAEVSRSAGAHGIVCSGQEAAIVHATHGEALALLVPGVRPRGVDAHDQLRTVTPEQARDAGARYLVLGRAVTAAADPRAALVAIAAAVRGD
jgi:orotidine-5'-phosphate decarboxylase